MRHDRASTTLRYNDFQQTAVLVNPGTDFQNVYDLPDDIYDTLIVQNGSDQIIVLEFEDREEPTTKYEMRFLADQSIAVPFNHSGSIRLRAEVAAVGNVMITSV